MTDVDTLTRRLGRTPSGLELNVYVLVRSGEAPVSGYGWTTGELCTRFGAAIDDVSAAVIALGEAGLLGVSRPG